MPDDAPRFDPLHPPAPAPATISAETTAPAGRCRRVPRRSWAKSKGPALVTPCLRGPLRDLRRLQGIRFLSPLPDRQRRLHPQDRAGDAVHDPVV